MRGFYGNKSVAGNTLYQDHLFISCVSQDDKWCSFLVYKGHLPQENHLTIKLFGDIKHFSSELKLNFS